MRAVAAQKAPLHYRTPLTRASCAGFEARCAKNAVFACSPAGLAVSYGLFTPVNAFKRRLRLYRIPLTPPFPAFAGDRLWRGFEARCAKNAVFACSPAGRPTSCGTRTPAINKNFPKNLSTFKNLFPRLSTRRRGEHSKFSKLNCLKNLSPLG